MRKAKVIVLSLGAKDRNTIFKAEDVITENQVDNFDLLIKGKYIEEIKEVDLKAEAKAKEEAEAKAKEEAEEKPKAKAKSTK